jgi:hypothetical protein
MIDSLLKARKEERAIENEYTHIKNNRAILLNKQLMIYMKDLKEKISYLENLNKKLFEQLNIYKVELKTRNLMEKNLILRNKGENKRKSTKKIIFDSKLLNKTNEIESRSPKLLKANSTLTISTPSNYEKRLLKLEKKFEMKNSEKEVIIMENMKLKNRLYLYTNKCKGLFSFLELCLNKFFNDEEIRKKKNFYVKLEDIKNLKFEDFTSQEQYALLMLLMKHLLPIIPINFKEKNNLIQQLFKTQVNIIGRNLSFNKLDLKDPILTFNDKSNRFFHELKKCKTIYNTNSNAILRKLKDIDLNFFKDKNKAINY